jgi:calcineurin-like phosphoesterase family protein
MVNLAAVINGDTYTISDTHMGHHKVLAFEPIRLEYLSDYNTDVVSECQEVLNLLETVPQEEHRKHSKINQICKYLIDFHDDMIVEKWNSVVGEDDTVIHLGDFAFRGIEEHTKRLNGNKILLRGNHDHKSARTYIEAGWKDVIESVKIIIGDNVFEKTPRTDKYWNGLFKTFDDKTVLLSHYPIYNHNVWDMKKYGPITDMLAEIYENIDGDINIAGHTHSQPFDYENGISVSIENCTGLRPMKIKDVLMKYKDSKCL